jgi:phosphohistidine swiveling domain-containing protein
MASSIDFGTKSETLASLRQQVKRSKVLPLIFFTENEWHQRPTELIKQIQQMATQDEVIVRSSAQQEDNADSSMAGAFTSILNVPTKNIERLEQAINKVIRSFQNHQHMANQILVQPMLTGIQMSGVVMTHDLQSGSPYYTINYDDESGKTDTITGGIGAQKTVLIYRDTDLSNIRSSRVKQLLIACKELESLLGHVPLDIEFALDAQETVYILQTRRIALCNTWHPLTEKRVARQLGYVSDFLTQHLSRQHGVYGEKSILGVMPDWNPAEIIGASPRPLASSLYRHVITDDIWLQARQAMGYFTPAQSNLMVIIGHYPYIDTRLSFNSFLPDGICPKTAEKLINAWILRLQNNPQYHDKVEFEIAHTCVDFSFKSIFDERYPNLLTDSEFSDFYNLLRQLTINALTGNDAGSMSSALADIEKLAKLQERRYNKQCGSDLATIKTLLDDTKRLGTKAFSIVARHGFIAETLLKSACHQHALSTVRLQEWKQSIETVSSHLTRDYAKVMQGKLTLDEFLVQFGHLRPSTYDITSLRYDERSDLFTQQSGFVKPNSDNDYKNNQQFEWQTDELDALQTLLEKQSFPITAKALLIYAEQAIQAREYAKLVFTRNLSDAMAMLSLWGAEIGLSRDDLSFIDIRDILDTLTVPLLDEPDWIWLDRINQAQQAYNKSNLLKLGHLISSPEDVYVVPLHRAMPNFITQRSIEAATIILHTHTSAATDLSGKIICIENADPGYDWIFTKDIAGLITQYGGANSHMAIRCAEFAIPAAIGCGEQLFNQLQNQPKVLLNCRDKSINKV